VKAGLDRLDLQYIFGVDDWKHSYIDIGPSGTYRYSRINHAEQVDRREAPRYE